MKQKIILTVIFIVAAFFRFWQLTQYPVSLSMDEVAIGWNAYSILKTGHDEWGEFLPLAFKSAGDYKPPVNIYLTVPSILIFGFNELAVRFPSAFFGSITPIFLVLLLLKLKFKPSAAYLTGFWLAISPWHIHFSRASFEAITALFFLIVGMYFFLSWIEKPKLSKIILWLASFSLSVWAYHAERLFVPFLVLSLIIIYHRQINLAKIKNQIIIGSIVLAIFVIPFVKLTFFTPAITTRAAVTSIMREPSLSNSLHYGNYSNPQELILNNDIYLIFRHWLGKYINYFNFQFIFWDGLQFTKPGYPGSGLLYFIDLPIFLLGIFSLVQKKGDYLKKLALLLFFLGPLPASFTMNEQHPLRALVWIPGISIIIASAYEKLLSFKKKKIFLTVYFSILLINNFYFIDIYKYQFPKHFSEYWQYGYKQVAQYSCDNLKKYNEIIISDTFGSDGPLNTGLPYLYVLFYCQADPKKFMETKSIDKFSFHRITWKVDSTKPNRLLIASPWDFLDANIPKDQIVKQINFLNNKPGFLFVTTKND